MTTSWWYMSFANDDRFLGGCFISGETFADAITRTHLLEINPGGEILATEIAMDAAGEIPEHWRERLLSRAELEQFDREMSHFDQEMEVK